MPTSCLLVRLYDGTGNLFPAETKALITITDGNQNQVLRQYVNAGQVRFQSLPFYDNFGDNYAVLAYVEGYRQAGYAPVKLSPDSEATVDLMLAPSNPVFNFAGLSWAAAQKKMPFLSPQEGEAEQDAEQRFTQLIESDGSKSLACMMNLVTAMDAIDLDGNHPFRSCARSGGTTKCLSKIDSSLTVTPP